MSEPTLAMIQAERAQQRAENEANAARLLEEGRIEKKRNLLGRFAQSLEELDREIAMSKELRKALKTNIGELKELRDAMAPFGSVDDLSFEDIMKHTEAVREAVRQSALRNVTLAGDFKLQITVVEPSWLDLAALTAAAPSADRCARAA